MAGQKSLTGDLLFDQCLQEIYADLQEFSDVDLVIGVPFYNEIDTLVQVLLMIENTIMQIKTYRNPLLLCIGDPAGKQSLEIIKSLELKINHKALVLKPGICGRGTSLRSMLEIANDLEADLVILAADITLENKPVFSQDLLMHILTPLEYDYDLILTTIPRNYGEDVVMSFMLGPIIEMFYGYRLNNSISRIYAISHDLVEDLTREIKFWATETRGHGFDPWLLTRVIRWNKKICEVSLGVKLQRLSIDKLNFVVKEYLRAIFECIKRDEEFWVERKLVFIKTPDKIETGAYDAMNLSLLNGQRELIMLFKRSFHQYRRLYENMYEPDLCHKVERAVLTANKDFRFSGRLWAEIFLALLLKYWFTSGISHDDILNALTFALDGRIASYMNKLELIDDLSANIPESMSLDLLSGVAEKVKHEQHQEFFKLRDKFVSTWNKKSIEAKPPLIPAHYLEFIPGIPIVLPKVIKGKGGQVVYSEELFNRLQEKYQSAFDWFIYEMLKVPREVNSDIISGYITNFMHKLENTMDSLFPGNLYTKEGIEECLHKLFSLFPHPRMYSIKDSLFKEMLLNFPPINVMIPAGCKNTSELLEKMDMRDAVSLANIIETRKYSDRALLWVLENLRPESMQEVEIKHLVLDDHMRDIARFANISDLNKITTRIVVRPLNKGMGGDYPKLRFCLFIARHIMIARNYARIWKNFARERKNLGNKIRNSLIGQYETTAFSAHNVFENWHHRALVGQFKALAKELSKDGHDEEAKVIELMCYSYGLSQVLADGTFMPLSAWSWSSFSYKGGSGVPTPLSSHVEESWFNVDLLEQIYRDLGYNTIEIKNNVIQLIGEGRASENLLDILLGVRAKNITVIAREAIDYPPAKPMIRYADNPILLPIAAHYWESKYVLNAAAIRINNYVYILYRAFGDDEISRIGLAITDGYHVLERLEDPIFIPQDDRENKGCEDPRVVLIEDELYMIYTAYNGVIAQISAASIKLDDFFNRRWDLWKRKGYAFEDIWNKDAILFPEKINGRYCIFHRIEPSIWVSYLDNLEFPVPKEKHSIILGPRSGMMWDSLKIGAGTQPIKTKYGWLLIYHGVDRKRVYRLGVILVDLHNPEKLLYRSPNPVLSPETQYEVGDAESWVPNVVFTCGAVSAEEKELLDASDTILVYYGAADTYICLATTTVGDLIPKKIRQKLEANL